MTPVVLRKRPRTRFDCLPLNPTTGYTWSMSDTPTSAAASGATSGEPTPPLIFVADFIEIKTEPMRATLLLKSGLSSSGLTVTKEDAEKKLAELKVVFGIDGPAIEKIISEKIYDRAQIIATGKSARPSQDAWIEEKIKIDPNLDPVLDKDGKADYKNVDNIHVVKKGEVLAVKHPFIAPEIGSDIFGKSPEAKAPSAPKDVLFRLGANTEVSADGMQLIASVGGYAFHQAGAIHVGVTYTLKGDVDFHTGNLHYEGDIQVLGNVTSGFIVEAKGNIVVEGNVDAADVISHEGDVTIKSAIFGHGHGRIEAKGNLFLQSAQDVNLICKTGTITVEKALRNCNVTAFKLKADAPGCSILGGDIKAFAEVAVAALGGEGCNTHILIVDKDADAAKQKLKVLEKELTVFNAKLEPVEKRLKGMKTMAAKFGGTLSDRMKADLKVVLDQYMVLKGEEKILLTEKETMVGITKAVPKHVGRFMITEKVVWGASVELYGHHHDLVEEDAHKEWIWAPTGLMAMSLLPEATLKPEGMMKAEEALKLEETKPINPSAEPDESHA